MQQLPAVPLHCSYAQKTGIAQHLALHDSLAHALSLLSLQLSQAHTSCTCLQIFPIPFAPLPAQYNIAAEALADVSPCSTNGS